MPSTLHGIVSVHETVTVSSHARAGLRGHATVALHATVTTDAPPPHHGLRPLTPGTLTIGPQT